MLLTHYIQISRAIGGCAITMIGRKQGFYHSRSLCCGWYCQTHDLDKTIPWTTRIKHYRQYAVSREQKCNVVWTKRMGEFMRMLPSSKHLIFLRDSDRSNWNEKYKYQVLPSRSKDRWLYDRTPTWKELKITLEDKYEPVVCYKQKSVGRQQCVGWWQRLFQHPQDWRIKKLPYLS